MSYKAKQVDTDKALAYINSCRTYQDQRESIEYEKVKKFHEGVRKGLDIAEEIFSCSNYESTEGTYRDGVLSVIYELAKELDIPAQDIRDSGKSVDEMCADFADRIRASFSGEKYNDPNKFQSIHLRAAERQVRR